jgi:hypothetical protein
MVAGQFVPKELLFRQIRQIVGQRETGFLTILTDTKRSVLLRFSAGKLTHSHCRTKDVADAISVLTECALVKFTYAAAQVENRPEIMPTDTFLQLIDPGGDAGINPQATSYDAPSTSPAVDTQYTPPVAPTPRPEESAIRQPLAELALDYIGPIADMIVDEALETTENLTSAIDYIAGMLPDEDQANAFREDARSRFPDL